MQQSITTNTLFYGDNLAIMSEYIPDESVDHVYLGPRGHGGPGIRRGTQVISPSSV